MTEELHSIAELQSRIRFLEGRVAELEGEVLLRQKKILRTLLDAIPENLCLIDMDGTILAANRTLAGRCDASARDLVGSPISSLLPPELNATLMRQVARVVQLGTPLSFEGDWREEHLLYRLHPVLADDGRVQSVSVHSFSLTDINRTAQALRESEEKFSRAFFNAPLLMTISNIDDGRYIDVNHKFIQVSGFSREEAIGKTSVELGWLTQEDRVLLVECMRSRGRVSGMELVLTAKNGAKVNCLFHGEMISVSGQPRLLSIALDITEHKRLLEESIKAQKLDSLGVLAGGIAHDFNNILTGILGNLSFARMLLDPSHPAAALLEKSEKASIRASELTRQLLTFARGGEPVKKQISAAPLVRDAVSFALHGANVSCALCLDEDLWQLEADAPQLSQALSNLLLNAAQAMPDGGVITVSAVNLHLPADNSRGLAAGPYLEIGVADHGPGIPQQILQRIFEPYFTTRERGSGLGLTSAYSIARKHGGTVTVDSTEGKGSRFTLLLPAIITAGNDAQPTVSQPLSPGHGTILVMDDEAMIREIASDMLYYLGYEAVCCADGLEALKHLLKATEKGERFSAALLDLTVPGGMGGKEAALRLRQVDPDLPLIVASGYSSDPVLANFSEYGFNAAISKPFDMDSLGRELARLIRQP